jgi:hypothetical protein
LAIDRGRRDDGGHALRARALQAIAAEDPPGTGWVKTEERFIDPDTGKTVDVFYDPRSGERQYVSQGPDRQ